MRQTALTFKPKPIDDRKETFIKAIKAINLERLILDETEIELFLLHWAAVNPGGFKMHWEKFKTWEAAGRLRTWEIKSRKSAKDPNLRDYWDPYFDKKLANPQLQMNYRKHLRSLGHTITYSPGSGETIKPPKK